MKRVTQEVRLVEASTWQFKIGAATQANAVV